MEGDVAPSDQVAYLWARLSEIPGYIWEKDRPPFHSSYDNWHFFGSQTPSKDDTDAGGRATPAENGHHTFPVQRPPLRARDGESTVASPTSVSSPHCDVVARVSRHALRLEREFQLCKRVLTQSETASKHFVRPIEFVRLPSRQGHDNMVVSIFEAPGKNYLKEIIQYGPATYKGTANHDVWDISALGVAEAERMPMMMFLDFAIGAAECLEILHHGCGIVHGELRSDAFHFEKESGTVKMINFGSGPRWFESGLTSAGWSKLSQEVGVEHKIQFIAPEQTGRLPAEPDSRTDIYSLGILFWTMLTGELPFDALTPLDIMQNVLSRRIAPVISKRPDIPNVLSLIIQRMTQKSIDERYNSATGLRHDLQQVKKFVEEGDHEAIKSFSIGSKDISAFFTLPTRQIGRVEEHKKIVDTIEKVARAYNTQQIRRGLNSWTSGSSVSDSRLDNAPNEDGMSDTTSSGKSDSRQNSLQNDGSLLSSLRTPQRSEESIGEPDTQAVGRGHPDIRSPIASKMFSSDTKSTHGSLNGSVQRSTSIQHSSAPPGTHTTDSVNHLLRRAQKMRRKLRSEIISISGLAGMGKSCLVQSIQVAAQRHGYFASAKFDQMKRTPFDPLLRVMSSLFRQIFSENDVGTDFHNNIRTFALPLWPILHSYLDLPEWLLTASANQGPHKTKFSSSRRPSSPALHCTGQGKTAADWLRSGGTSKSSRFMSTYLDVLRLLTAQRFVCVCVDDLQFADDESIEAIQKIVASRIPIMMIVTHRLDAVLPTQLQGVLKSATKIELSPLKEDETADYICATLHRDRDYVVPLVAVVHQRTQGNPFFIREMLNVCHRKGCIYYSWKDSQWQFDLDKLFAEFVSESHTTQMNNEYVSRRFMELPEVTRSLLAWASLIGTSFSFSLLKKLVRGEDLPPDATGLPVCMTQEPIVGLQTALSTYILVPGDDEDRFRFAHDRYMQAAAVLTDGYNINEMHFAIAKAMIDYDYHDNTTTSSKALYVRSRHVCLAIDLIKARVTHRSPYRDLLYRTAEDACDSGARASALFYFKHCLKLLQDDPWDNSKSDVFYQETLTLFTRSADAYWYQGFYDAANKLLHITLENVRDPVDKAPAWILQSRVHALQGDSFQAFESLRQCLDDLGLKIKETSWEQCDAEFLKLCQQFQMVDKNMVLRREVSNDRGLLTIGPVLVELLSAAFWSNSLLFFQLSLRMVDYHLNRGTVPQVSLGYVHLGSIAAGRFGMMQLAVELGSMAKCLFDIFPDNSYTLGRGYTLHSLFLGHLESDMKDQIPVLQQAYDHSNLAGDRIMALLNRGIAACFMLWSSHDLADIDAFVSEAPLEFPMWQEDLRGGVFLHAVRQYCRALQGKTKTSSPQNLFSDAEHSTSDYLNFIEKRASNPKRPKTIYTSFMMVAMFRYGHMKEAIELGERLLLMMDSLLSMRIYYMNIFYLSLAYINVLREDSAYPNREEIDARLAQNLEKLRTAASVHNANYKFWIEVLEAEISDLNANYAAAIQHFEAALDHAEIYALVLDEALAFELYAETLIRRGACRPARRLLAESMSAYRRVNATGKSQHIAEKYGWILQGTSSLTMIDTACQTEATDTDNTAYKLEQNEDETNVMMGMQTSADRTQAWLGPSDVVSPKGEAGHAGDLQGGFSALGLDMIDLASILESNQLMSSELQTDRLLGKMTEIILESTGAELGAIIVEDEEVGWVIAACGTPDGMMPGAAGQPIDKAEDQLSLKVAHYALRFKEIVFVQNLYHDERFSNVPDSYRQRNPDGKAVIAIPIVQGGDVLLGVIYLEGPANGFSERNITVLRLLVNQIAISLANSLLFKRLERAMASNVAMLDAQKRSLSQAREAEIKAKEAELVAIRNMKLKEEAAKAKSLFLANVSHELRTPLNGCIGMSELLKGSALDEDQKGYVDSIRVCADTLLSIINDLLDFSKLEAGKMNVYTMPLNLTETISEVVRALSYTNMERGLETIEKLEVDPNLMVMGDPVRLHQILMNLLSNSYKFTNKGYVTVKAVVNREDDTSIDVTCSVADTGIGISEEQRKKLFLPFSQIQNSSSRSYGGTGLGLSICKAIIENVMNGKIWLESTPNVGTTVFFSLSFKKVLQADADRAESTEREPDLMAKYSHSDSPTPAAGLIDLSKIPRDQLRICIAEDNPVNQKIAISFVQRLGFKCEAFVDGRKAVDALTKASSEGNPFHLVLMDVQMPILDGYDATREIRKHPDPMVRDVLVIAMTASAIQGDREKCLDAGMNDYLAKPVRAQTLKALLESYLSQSSKPMPKLHQEAQQLAKQVVAEATQAQADGASAAASPVEDTISTQKEVDGTNGTSSGVATPATLRDGASPSR